MSTSPQWLPDFESLRNEKHTGAMFSSRDERLEVRRHGTDIVRNERAPLFRCHRQDG
jgi:hypothetical protein